MLATPFPTPIIFHIRQQPVVKGITVASICIAKVSVPVTIVMLICRDISQHISCAKTPEMHLPPQEHVNRQAGRRLG